MENKIKCFSEEHKEIDAISFCPECRIYMCNKCENIHSSFFKNHKIYKLTNEEEIFMDFVKKKIIQLNQNIFVKIIINYVADYVQLNQIKKGKANIKIVMYAIQKK